MAFTYFFRDVSTLEILAEHIVPGWRGKKFINIWDAGCAMGPESFSLAIIVRKHIGRFAFRNVKIYATDVDSSNLFATIIREAVYPYSQVRRIPQHIFEEYFVPADVPGSYRVRDDIRDSVRYTRHDLLSLKPARRNFDLVLCKNVLLHFSQQQRIAVLKMFHSALAEGGYLAMEQTQQMPKELSERFKRICINAQIYRKSLQTAAGEDGGNGKNAAKPGDSAFRNRLNRPEHVIPLNDGSDLENF